MSAGISTVANGWMNVSQSGEFEMNRKQKKTVHQCMKSHETKGKQHSKLQQKVV